ncbi:glutathione S-transferase C-terminal domain-containing protein homolog [Homalodisca vitripennis]|uniref:glutathione S-transferase C-terminal domain-containing protein homolog n=1 Tax=Homalodisca vitripennis TaxID=197043 RepID=UPI001EEB430E|nr:glutathione S-transferase C-terminal domain-containing protein homolog [Homalodisca vitripennis]
MAKVFLEVYNLLDEIAEVPVPSAVCIFLMSYLRSPSNIELMLVESEREAVSLSVNVGTLRYRSVTQESLNSPIRDCHLPVFSTTDTTSCVAGLCAVLRQIVKNSGEEWRHLLGFREGCLFACAEVSLWTRFCEIDIIEVVKDLSSDTVLNVKVFEVPRHLARFEEHLKQPVRMHNVDKLRKKMNRDCVDHEFAEGHTMSLADLMIVPCVRVIFKLLSGLTLAPLIPSVLRWYQLVISQDHVSEALDTIQEVPSQFPGNSVDINCVLPEVPLHSLYKSDPKRYKPKWKIFTRQDDVDAALKVVEDLALDLEYDPLPFGHEVPLDWQGVPGGVQPDVPSDRLARKRQQLENLSKAIIKVARPGDTIVDFCCGSGHLGIVVAHCLPQCHVVLLDNKEESLARAKARVRDLTLSNVTVIQCNLDYFKGSFQIGVSLHACGVASDLVIHSCLQRNATFIVCPCCYGSLQNNHMVSYPQSSEMSLLSLHHYLVLGHCADQTHKQLYDKSAQGERCMAIVDYDRCLLARERGYSTSLAKLIPQTCSPKNNLIVGIPNNFVF